MNIPQEILNGEYTSPILAKILRVPLRKVTSMLERGYIVSTIQDAAGHGSKRLFSFDDVLRAFIIHNLESFGLSVEKLRYVSSLLSEPGQLDLPFLLFDEYGDRCPVGDSPTMRVPLEKMRGRVVLRIYGRDPPGYAHEHIQFRSE